MKVKKQRKVSGRNATSRWDSLPFTKVFGRNDHIPKILSVEGEENCHAWLTAGHLV